MIQLIVFYELFMLENLVFEGGYIKPFEISRGQFEQEKRRCAGCANVR